MTLVYRIEDQNGSGPYIADRYEDANVASKIKRALAKTLCRAHSNGDLYPDASRDMMYGDRSGFISIDQLLAWFDGYLDRLHRNKFKLAIYEVPDSDIDYSYPKQVVFKIRNLKPIKKYSIPNIPFDELKKKN